MKRTGFIAIVGRPNVGKSTLMNSILGEKVAIVSSKPQTTRNRITGIHTKGDSQFVFLDTPGMHNPKNSLGEYMVKAADSTMRDADAVVLVVDTGNVAGFEPSVQMDIQAVSGAKNMIFGGEGIFNTVLTGPGRVWLQTMPIYNVANAIRPYIPTSSK